MPDNATVSHRFAFEVFSDRSGNKVFSGGVETNVRAKTRSSAPGTSRRLLLQSINRNVTGAPTARSDLSADPPGSPIDFTAREGYQRSAQADPTTRPDRSKARSPQATCGHRTPTRVSPPGWGRRGSCDSRR